MSNQEGKEGLLGNVSDGRWLLLHLRRRSEVSYSQQPQHSEGSRSQSACSEDDTCCSSSGQTDIPVSLAKKWLSKTQSIAQYRWVCASSRYACVYVCAWELLLLVVCWQVVCVLSAPGVSLSQKLINPWSLAVGTMADILCYHSYRVRFVFFDVRRYILKHPKLLTCQLVFWWYFSRALWLIRTCCC